MAQADALVQLIAEAQMDIKAPIHHEPVITSRDCPVLQDINGEIAYILLRCNTQSDKETVNELINTTEQGELQEARLKIFAQ